MQEAAVQLLRRTLSSALFPFNFLSACHRLHSAPRRAKAMEDCWARFGLGLL
ncbi:unnamed protein product [Onchocerca flexuosa]|uniref:Uncharacterized protein n=1 Tax=Onchocerca flexuosa TaxID=387005 RepID=A0A183HD15_9BILA|nr:unnamed protein product [Onchocerca flexuosa]